MRLSEVHEELFSHFLSRDFCSRVPCSARSLSYGCESMRFLRSFAEVNPAFSPPMVELAPWPLELEHLLQATMG